MPLNTHTHVTKQKRPALDALTFGVVLAVATLLALTLYTASSTAATSQAANSGGAGFEATPATTPGMRAKIAADGRTALAPADAPQEVKDAINAANKITRKPYIYGGGHATFKKLSRGYDCSSTISYALGNAGLLESPLNSTGFFNWGKKGKGTWITVYTNPGHAYAVIAGLRLDTSGPGERGPRWRKESRSSKGFRSRSYKGL